MNPEIASIHDRLGEGGNWYRAREEVARLHEIAATQDEFVVLLEAHSRLVAVLVQCFAPEKAAELRGIAYGEYKAFLLAEAQEQGRVNPLLLDRITAREVQAGRLDEGDPFRQLALAGGSLGDSSDLVPGSRMSNLLALGSLALAVVVALQTWNWAYLWLAAPGFIVGWMLNERRRKRLIADVRAERMARGY